MFEKVFIEKLHLSFASLQGNQTHEAFKCETYRRSCSTKPHRASNHKFDVAKNDSEAEVFYTEKSEVNRMQLSKAFSFLCGVLFLAMKGNASSSRNDKRSVAEIASVMTRACGISESKVFHYEVELFYMYEIQLQMKSHEIEEAVDVFGIEKAIASELARSSSICMAIMSHPSRHTVVTGPQCSQLSVSHHCHVVRGLTHLFVDVHESDLVAPVTVDHIENILADSQFLNKFSATHIEASRLTQRMGEHITPIKSPSNTVAESEGAGQTAIIAIVILSALCTVMSLAVIFLCGHKRRKRGAPENEPTHKSRIAYFVARRRQFWDQLEGRDLSPGIVEHENQSTFSVSDLTSQDRSVQVVMKMDRILEEEAGTESVEGVFNSDLSNPCHRAHDEKTLSVSSASSGTSSSGLGGFAAQLSFIRNWHDTNKTTNVPPSYGSPPPRKVWEKAGIPPSYFDDTNPESPVRQSSQFISPCVTGSPRSIQISNSDQTRGSSTLRVEFIHAAHGQRDGKDENSVISDSHTSIDDESQESTMKYLADSDVGNFRILEFSLPPSIDDFATEATPDISGKSHFVGSIPSDSENSFLDSESSIEEDDESVPEQLVRWGPFVDSSEETDPSCTNSFILTSEADDATQATVRGVSRQFRGPRSEEMSSLQKESPHRESVSEEDDESSQWTPSYIQLDSSLDISDDLEAGYHPTLQLLGDFKMEEPAEDMSYSDSELSSQVEKPCNTAKVSLAQLRSSLLWKPKNFHRPVWRNQAEHKDKENEENHNPVLGIHRSRPLQGWSRSKLS